MVYSFSEAEKEARRMSIEIRAALLEIREARESVEESGGGHNGGVEY